MKIYRSEDCGNSPKNKFTEDFVVAVLAKNTKKVVANVGEDFCCMLPDASRLEDVQDMLNALRNAEVANSSAYITHVVSHGKAAAVNGVVKTGKKVEKPFCCFLEFTSASAKAVRKLYLHGFL